MSIRNQVSANFTVILNAVLQDERLSTDALGLLVFLLHHPRDWIVRQKHLGNRFSIGREKVQRLMRELQELSYVRRVVNRNLDIPAPRPLYGLPEILARPDATVIITEGEKSCEAVELTANHIDGSEPVPSPESATSAAT